MPDRIQINCERVEENAMGVENAAVYLQNVSLVPQDMKTTLPANANSKAAYERAQGRISNLGTMLDQEAKNIRGLNMAFEEFDRMLGRFGENKNRYPEITARP